MCRHITLCTNSTRLTARQNYAQGVCRLLIWSMYATQAGPAVHPLESAPFKGQEPSVTMSVWDKPCVKTFKELCDLSLSQISAIWSVS